MTGAVSAAQGDSEHLLEEQDAYDVWEELNDGETVHISEVPVPISIPEILNGQPTDRFCPELLCGQYRGTGKFVDTDYGVLRRVPLEEGAAQQIVVPEALRPRPLNITHNAKLAGHPGQKKMYARLKKGFYWPQMAADVANTVRRCPTCARNRLNILEAYKSDATIPRKRVSRFCRS